MREPKFSYRMELSWGRSSGFFTKAQAINAAQRYCRNIHGICANIWQRPYMTVEPETLVTQVYNIGTGKIVTVSM